MWEKIIIISIIAISVITMIVKRGRLPGWHDKHGEEYLKWLRGEESNSDASD